MVQPTQKKKYTDEEILRLSMGEEVGTSTDIASSDNKANSEKKKPLTDQEILELSKGEQPAKTGQKKNNTDSQVLDLGTQTNTQTQTPQTTQANNMGGGKTPPPYYDFNSYFGSVVDALPEEKKSLLFRPKQAAAVEAYKKVPEATKEKMQPSVVKSTAYKGDELRQDGKTPKGTGWFGVQKTPDGKDMTEYTISFTVDGKDIEVPTLNPYLTSYEVKKLVETGEVTDEIEKKTLQWYKDRTAEGKDVFISENDNQIDISEGYKITALIDAIPIDDIKAATGQPNPYPLASQQAADYENKVAASEQSKEEIENWIIQTTNPSTLESYTPNDYFEWQRQYQKEMEENMPYYMNDFYDYAAKMKAEHPEWSDDELNKSLDDYWNMFTVKNFQNIESAAWEKFSESQKTSMKDAPVPEKLDYIFSSVASNTVIGNFSAYSKAIIDASIDAVEGGEGNVGEFYRENMGFVKENRSKYKDLSTVQEITETAILLSADMPVFNILGAGASAVTNYGWRAASEVATIMGVPANVAKIAAIQSGLNIAKAGVNTGVLLGSYDTLLAIGDKLSTTKVSELDSNDYKDFVNSFNKGAVAGMAVGVFSGITHGLLQKMNSNAIRKLYPVVNGEVTIPKSGGTAGLKLLNTGIHIGAGVIEGGLIFPLAHAAYDYADGNKNAFKDITVESVIEDGIKFAIAIKAQQLPSIVEQIKTSNYMIDPNFKKPFENGFVYSEMELNRWGVKDIAELKEKIKDESWLKETKDKKQITNTDFLKVMYDSQGLMFNNKITVDKSVATTIDGKPVLVSYDKKGNTIDISEYKTEAEAKKAEYVISEVNTVDKIITNSAELDSKAIIELNAEYEKNPEKLIAINEALLKDPTQRTASESQLLLEVADKIDKQLVRVESEKQQEVKPKTEKDAIQESEKINLENKKDDIIFAETKVEKNGKPTEIQRGTTSSVQEVQSRTQSDSSGMQPKQNRVDNFNATEQEWRGNEGNNGERKIERREEQPIISTLLTGHKSPFNIFDRKFRGSGFGNQGGGVFLTTDPAFALESAKKSASGGYAFNKQEATNTPYISEVVIRNPNMVYGQEPIPEKILKQIGEINGINPSKFKEYSDFYDELTNSFIKDKSNFSDYTEAQNKASDSLREKGITGHVIDKNEIVIYNENDIVKTKQTRITEPLLDKVTLNDKEYTVREENGKNEVYVKNEQGLLTREKDNKVIEDVLDLSFAKEISKDVTLLNTQQKEKDLRQQKEMDGESELNDLIEKKTKELMKDIEADYDGQVTIGGIDIIIKKQFGRGKKLDIFVKNFKGDHIHMEDMEGITPFSKKQMGRIKNVALRKFLSENATIVDMTYEQIAQYRQEQKAIIDKRIDAEIEQEISEYQKQRDKLYADNKLSTENVEIPENIEKQKSNFLGKLKTSKDIDATLSEVRNEKWFKELNSDTQDVVHAMFRDFGEKQLGIVGKEAKMTPAEKSPASQKEFIIKFGTYLRDLEIISNKARMDAERESKKAKKEGEKIAKETIRDFISIVRKSLKDVADFLSPSENKTILSQLEKMTNLSPVSTNNAMDKIMNILNSAYGESKLPTSPKEYRTLNDVRIARDKAILRTINETSKTIRLFEKNIIDLLKENRKEGTLTDIKYNSLIKRISETIKETKRKDGTVVTPDMKRQAVMDYVVESLIDASNRKSFKQASSQRKKAEKLLKAKNVNFGNKTSDAMRAMKIDLQTLTPEQVAEYNRIVGEMLSNKNRQNPESIDKFIKDLNDIEWTPEQKKVKTAEDARKLVDEIAITDIETLSDYKAAKSKLKRLNNLIEKIYSDKVNNAAGTPEQIAKQKEEAFKEKEELLDLINSKNGEMDLSTIIKSEGDIIKQGHLDNIQETTKEFITKTPEETGLPEKSVRDYKKFFAKLNNKEVIERLTPEDMELIDYATTNLSEGFVNGLTHKAVLKVMDTYNNILGENVHDKTKNNTKTKKLKALENETDVTNKFRTVNDFRTDEVFGSFGHAWDRFLYSETRENVGEAQKFEVETAKPLTDALTELKNEKGFKDKIKGKNDKLFGANEYDKSIDKIASIRLEAMWQANNKIDLETGRRYELGDKSAPEYMANHQDAVFHRVKSEQQAKDSKYYRRSKSAWDKIKSDKTNFNADGSLNIEKMYNELSPAEKKVYDEFSKFNETLEPYTEMAAIKHGRNHVKVNNYDFYHKLNEGISGKETAETYTDNLINSAPQPTKQASSSYERDMGARLVRTDIDKVMKLQLQEVSHDMFVRDRLLSTMRALDHISKTDKEFTRIAKGLKTTIGERAARSQGIGVKDLMADKFYSYLSAKALGNPNRIIKELPVNMLKQTITQMNKDITIAKKVETPYVDMLETMIGDNSGYSQYAADLSKSDAWGTRKINDIIIFSDKLVAPRSFKVAFNESFKKQTGKDFDVKKFQSDPNYSFENFEAIEVAKSDGMARLQELFNSKTSIGAATHVRMGNYTMDKKSFTGKTLYFLQSYNHNEAKQIIRSTKMIAEGMRTKDMDMVQKGLRDTIAITATNWLYAQMGLAMLNMSRSYFQQVADDDNYNPIPAFEEGLAEYWKNSIANENVLLTSIGASIGNMMLGKYNNVGNLLLGITLGIIKDDKGIDPKVKEAFFQNTRTSNVQPINMTSDGYGSAKTFGKLHPILGEVVNLADIIESAGETAGLTEDNSELEVLFLVNSIIRLAYMNPASNVLDKWLQRYEAAKEKGKKEDSTDGKMEDGKLQSGKSFGDESKL